MAERKARTRILKLVLSGFKSFAKHTELVFDRGFSCILGPNGSGKSNIIDALCFVLGRLSSKTLRAERAANLIYNGGKRGKPLNKGEVSLYLDNSSRMFPVDSDALKITRIIKKNGQSIYKINDKKCTRQQIVDILAIGKIDPEGSNIILQGDIVRFTEMHADERRRLIEEIAGISVYEDKKHKALLELEKVEQKLREADVVLAERGRHLKELKKDKDQALRYKRLKEQFETSKASFLYLNIESKERKLKELRKKISEHKDALKKKEEQKKKLKESILRIKAQIAAINKDIEEKSKDGQARLYKNVEDTKVKLATAKTRLNFCEAEKEKIKRRREQLKSNFEDNKKEIAAIEKKNEELRKELQKQKDSEAALNAKITELKKRFGAEGLDVIEKELSETEEQIDALQKEVNALRAAEQAGLRSKDKIEYELRDVRKKIESYKELEKEHTQQLEELEKLRKELGCVVKELNECLDSDSSFAKQLHAKKDALRRKEEQLAKIKAKESHIKEHVLSNAAVRAILGLKKRGVHGIVADLLKVDPRYAMAIEIAAGAKARSIVVDNEKVAASCIRHLKKNRIGVATFLLLNKLVPEKIDFSRFLNKEGVIGPAAELVSCKPLYRKVVAHVLGTTLVVKDMLAAQRVGIGKVRMVTLDGDLIGLYGTMQGGFRKKSSILFKDNIFKELSSVKQGIDTLKEEIAKLEKLREKNEARISALKKKRAEIEGTIIRIEKSLRIGWRKPNTAIESSLLRRLKVEEARLSKLASKIERINSELLRLNQRKHELRAKLSQSREPKVLAMLAAYEEQKRAVQEKILRIKNSIKANEIKIRELLIPEQRKITQLIKHQERELRNFEIETAQLERRIAQLQNELVQHEKEAERFFSRYKNLFAQRDVLGAQIQQLEERIERLAANGRLIEKKINALSLESARMAAELAGIKEQFREFDGVRIDRSRDIQTLKKDFEKAGRALQNIGNVNMRALEVYNEVEKEYNAFAKKKERLEQERQDVLKMMEEIESKKKDAFMKTFNALNENFKRAFSMLSTKGEAFLELENEENPFDGGVSIKVRISSAKFLDVRSLSGGEKTLTALAFIFAIQEYEPHHFYIFDEVDAALDKKNSEMLAALLKKYSENAQYVIITHNDAIISAADCLYGVSMNEHGMSSIVTLRL